MHSLLGFLADVMKVMKVVPLSLISSPCYPGKAMIYSVYLWTLSWRAVKSEKFNFHGKWKVHLTS